MECEKKILGVFLFKAGSREDQQECHFVISISSQSSFWVKLMHETHRGEEEMSTIISAEHSWKSATLS